MFQRAIDSTVLGVYERDFPLDMFMCLRACMWRAAARGGSLWRRAVENYEVRSEAYKAYLDAKKAHEKANSILMGARMHALGQLGPAADADHVTFARHAARCKHIEGIVVVALARGTRMRRAKRRRW